MSAGLVIDLKTLVTGSETANGVWFEGVRIINNYGMSEAGFHVAQFELGGDSLSTALAAAELEKIKVDYKDRTSSSGSLSATCFR